MLLSQKAQKKGAHWLPVRSMDGRMGTPGSLDTPSTLCLLEASEGFKSSEVCCAPLASLTVWLLSHRSASVMGGSHLQAGLSQGQHLTTASKNYNMRRTARQPFLNSCCGVRLAVGLWKAGTAQSRDLAGWSCFRSICRRDEP